jgi:hypothetical protein
MSLDVRFLLDFECQTDNLLLPALGGLLGSHLEHAFDLVLIFQFEHSAYDFAVGFSVASVDVEVGHIAGVTVIEKCQVACLFKNPSALRILVNDVDPLEDACFAAVLGCINPLLHLLYIVLLVYHLRGEQVSHLSEHLKDVRR